MSIFGFNDPIKLVAFTYSIKDINNYYNIMLKLRFRALFLLRQLVFY